MHDAAKAAPTALSTCCGCVRLQADKGRILEMFSQQNEKVELERPVEAKGAVALLNAVTQKLCIYHATSAFPFNILLGCQSLAALCLS